MLINKYLLAAGLLGLSVSATAGTFSAMASGAPGSSLTLNVTFAGDNQTDNADVRIAYNDAVLTITAPVAATPADTCQILAAPARIRIIPRDGQGTPLAAAATTYCTFTVAIAANAPIGLSAFTTTTIGCASPDGPVAPCTLAAMSGVNVQNTPVPRTLAFNPAPGSTITFAAGMTPGAQAPTQNIAVTASGTTGNASVAGCAITGAGASSFSVAPASLTFNSSITQNLVVGCTYPTSAVSATLTCNETDADSAATPRAFTLSCPAPSVNPTIASAPVSGSTINVSGGLAGTQGLTTIDLSASNGSGAGSTAISCTSTGQVQIAASPANPSGQGPVNQTVTGTLQPSDLRVGVQLTAGAQPAAGTVTCTVAGQAPLTFTVNAPAGTTIVPPTFIPSASTWSTLALLSLLGVFGLLAVGFRRQ